MTLDTLKTIFAILMGIQGIVMTIGTVIFWSLRGARREGEEATLQEQRLAA